MPGMDKTAKIYIVGHQGLVGSATMCNLQAKGHTNLLLRTHAELDQTNQAATDAFFAQAKPECVFLAEARVGGIVANNSFSAEFIRDNLTIQTNIHIGVGTDVTIKELAEMTQAVVGCSGQIEFDASKPDGTPRKLIDVGRLSEQDWQAQTALLPGLADAYSNFVTSVV